MQSSIPFPADPSAEFPADFESEILNAFSPDSRSQQRGARKIFLLPPLSGRRQMTWTGKTGATKANGFSRIDEAGAAAHRHPAHPSGGRVKRCILGTQPE